MPTAWYAATCKDCAVRTSTQHTANHCARLLPVPLLPRRGGGVTHRGNGPFLKGGLRAAGCQGTSIYSRVSVQRTESACHADATSKANVSPAAITGACRGNCAFLSLQPATVIPPAVCPSLSVILPQETASASGSPRGNAVKNALYVLSFCYYFCVRFWKSSLPSPAFSLPEK